MSPGHGLVYFNPRAPCGARHQLTSEERSYYQFQSSRPVRGATNAFLVLDISSLFQSSRPVRGATLMRDDTTSHD